MAELDVIGLRNDPSLVAYWKLEGNDDDDTGTHNGVTDTGVGYGMQYGKYNQGANFGGAAGIIITINDAAALKPTGSFTIAAWVKLTGSLGLQRTIFQSYNETASPNGFQLDIESNNTFHFITTTNPGSQSARTNPNFITTGVWYHLAGVRSGTLNSIYVNGVRFQDQTTSVAPAYNATNFVRIGGRTTTAGGDTLPWEGNIDEVCLFSKALTAGEVQMLARDTMPLPNRLRPAIFKPGTAR